MKKIPVLRCLLPWKRTPRCVLIVLIGLPSVALAQFADTFDTISPAWTTDRYDPAGFQSASFLGDNRLQITIDQSGSTLNRPAPTYSASFYNTQGESRPGGITGDWTLSAEVYVSSAFDTTTGQLVRSSLWAHAGDTPTTGDYAIFGFTNASPTDPLNPDASDRSFQFQIFGGSDADPNGWFDAGAPNGFAFDAWHSIEIISTGTAFAYLLDGQLVYTDTTAIGAGLQTVSLQAYNFGQTDSNGLNNYSVYWDNAMATASIPEPASFALAAGLTTLGLIWKHRRARLFCP